MTPEQTEVARALVALPGWEWRAGMLTLPDPANPIASLACQHLGADRLRVLNEWDANGPCGAPEGWLPDLTDAGTGGVLLEMLGADPWLKLTVWRAPKAWGLWSVGLGGRPHESPFTGSTLAEAVARALLATEGDR